jgi:hypothetical protein
VKGKGHGLKLAHEKIAHIQHWNGEAHLLVPFLDELMGSQILCDDVVATKNEALVAGLALAELRREDPADRRNAAA